MRRILMAAATALAVGVATPAAAAVTFTGTNGSNLSASVTFDILSGNTLQVVLTNTSNVDVNDNPDVLQAVFFNIAGTPTLTYNDANLTAGSSFIGTVLAPGSTDVAAEWAYLQNSSGLGQGVTQDYGLSSAGYSIFGPGNVLGGAAHPDQGGSGSPPAGGDFGLVSAGYSTAGDANGFTNQNPHIKNSVTFLLTGFTGSLSDISGVRFQYGTATTETSLTGTPSAVPEPATWALMLLGFAAIGVSVRRRRGQPRLSQLA